MERPKLHRISYGSPEEALVSDAIATFTGATFSNLSFCTTPVELLSSDGKDTRLKHATGFFWRRHGIDFVVTNWHVVSGRNPFTSEPLDEENLYYPRRICVYAWKISSSGEKITFTRKGYTVDLGELGMSLFSSPPVVDGRVVDIAAIPTTENFAIESALDGDAKLRWGHVEPRVNVRQQDKISSQAGDECVILGYPLQNYSGLMLPIWKRGSLSTETNLAVDGVPAFLIDAATSPAMSGSPIFRRITGGVTVDRTTKVVSEARGFEFIGVYAGRLNSRELERINVGYGWFGNQVDAAIDHSWEIWKSVAAARNEGTEDLMRPVP